jgi:hypothetical protein
MAIPPAVKLSGSLKLSEIATTFGETTGTPRSMGVHSDQAWFVDGETGPQVPAFDTYTQPGTYSYIMPWHTGDVVIEAWGGGAGGVGDPNQTNGAAFAAGNGYNGGATTVTIGTTVLRANGGFQRFEPSFNGSNGGTASGGDVNTQGNPSPFPGLNGLPGIKGADAPNGGIGGLSVYGGSSALAAGTNGRGGAPGAGGGGTTSLSGIAFNGGGGSGAYVKKTMTIDTETTISIVVGAGGNGGVAGNDGTTYYAAGGQGAPGGVKISYTTADLTISYFPTTDIKFSQFYGKKGTDPSGSGSTTYNTTPQTSYSFVVPLYRTSLQIDAFGAGGGATSPSYAGGATTVVKTGLGAFSMTAGGGGGGGAGGSRSIGGSGGGGGATGGDINLSGGDGAGATTGGASGGYPSYGGGAGGPYPGNTGSYGAGGVPGGGASGFLSYDGSKYPAFSGAGGGGGGGFVRKTFLPKDLRAGSVLAVNVGTGVAGGGAGRVVITWSSPA